MCCTAGLQWVPISGVPINCWAAPRNNVGEPGLPRALRPQRSRSWGRGGWKCMPCWYHLSDVNTKRLFSVQRACTAHSTCPEQCYINQVKHIVQNQSKSLLLSAKYKTWFCVGHWWWGFELYYAQVVENSRWSEWTLGFWNVYHLNKALDYAHYPNSLVSTMINHELSQRLPSITLRLTSLVQRLWRLSSADGNNHFQHAMCFFIWNQLWLANIWNYVDVK